MSHPGKKKQSLYFSETLLPKRLESRYLRRNHFPLQEREVF